MDSLNKELWRVRIDQNDYEKGVNALDTEMEEDNHNEEENKDKGEEGDEME